MVSKPSHASEVPLGWSTGPFIKGKTSTQACAHEKKKGSYVELRDDFLAQHIFFLGFTSQHPRSRPCHAPGQVHLLHPEGAHYRIKRDWMEIFCCSVTVPSNRIHFASQLGLKVYFPRGRGGSCEAAQSALSDLTTSQDWYFCGPGCRKAL